MPDVVWKNEPEEHDFPAALAYLSLIADDEVVEKAIRSLHSATIAHYKAKDILRASMLALLLPDNSHVAADLDKIKHGKPLSPVLLIRGDVKSTRSLIVADGYHRVCASYHLDENTDIPCLLGDF